MYKKIILVVKSMIVIVGIIVCIVYHEYNNSNSMIAKYLNKEECEVAPSDEENAESSSEKTKSEKNNKEKARIEESNNIKNNIENNETNNKEMESIESGNKNEEKSQEEKSQITNNSNSKKSDNSNQISKNTNNNSTKSNDKNSTSSSKSNTDTVKNDGSSNNKSGSQSTTNTNNESSDKSSQTTKNTKNDDSNTSNKEANNTSSQTNKSTKIEVSKITLSAKPNSSIAIGYNLKLTAKLSPSNSTNKTIKWSSSNTTVATVDKDGLITGKKAGTATITAKIDNATATYKVTVRSRLRVIMIGNSKTFRQNLSAVFTNFANKDGIYFTKNTENETYSIYNGTKNIPFYFNEETGVNGKTLLYIINNKTSEIIGKNSDKSWDIVIMQEKTDRYYGDEANYEKGVKKIVDSLYKINPYTKFYIRKTWVLSESGSEDRKKGYSNTNTVIKNIKNAYKDKNLEISIDKIEDGKAMYAAKAKGITVFDDERHQNKHGAYLTAACIYLKVFNKNELNYNSGLSKESILKEIALEKCT